MAAMDGVGMVQQNQAPVERLSTMVQQQLNLETVKTRAISLFKAISRILEELDLIARTNNSNSLPRWQDVLGQFSMVNLELYNIVEDVKKVSKAFLVFPKNVNAENSTILPVMLSTKLLPEMEVEDNSKRDQVLLGIQNQPVSAQIEKLKTRIDMIAAACESAEKVLADTRKAYGFGTRQGPAITSTLDKAQAAKNLEQENLLRAAVNFGEGLRIPGDQRQITSALPLHLVDVLSVDNGFQSVGDTSGDGMYQKGTPPMSSNINNQTMLQASGSQHIGRSVPSPSFENTTSPLTYTNSPRSGTTNMNAPSPQQQQQHQQQQQQLQQQRQKMMQLPQNQQLLSQQHFRQSAMSGLGQNQQLHDLQGQSQTQQKFQTQQQMQFSQPLGHQQFQSRQLTSGQIQHGLGQSQLNQGNQLNRLSQFSGTANSALFNAAQTTPNTQMLSNISATMPNQSLLPRMQYTLPGANTQRSHSSQILSDQIYNNMGVASTSSGMLSLQQQQQQQQQQQHGSQGAFGNMTSNTQSVQSGMGTLQSTQQNHPNFSQQRQTNNQQQQ